MAGNDPVLWSEIGEYCDGRKDDCHQLIAAQFNNAVNEALDKKLTAAGVIVMSRFNYLMTVGLAVGTGFGGREAVKFLAAMAGIKVGP